MIEQFIATFLGFLFAFIVKDVYDIYFQKGIQNWLHKSKELPKQMITPDKKNKSVSNINILYQESIK